MKLEMKNLLAGMILGVACMLLIAARSGYTEEHVVHGSWHYGLITHQWPQMADARINDIYRPVGLFRIDRSTGDVWALVASAKGYDVEGWVPLERASGKTPETDGI